MQLTSLAGRTHLLEGEAKTRRDRDRAYLMSLTNDHLLFSHFMEAGLLRVVGKPNDLHGGWDSPLSDIRGTFCGHWLSAAAHIVRETGDRELKAKADEIVAGIGRCQEANGGQWAFPIPEKFLYRLKKGRHPWATQYVCHKNMMGLLDMYLLTGNEQALTIVKGCADWFYAFTNDISRETMSDMMDCEETGGILELWADLYAITGDEKHLTLLRRYERPRLAEPLLAGVDVLCNMHANATIPEMQGYARAYEVTGEERYRKVVQAYWDQAVDTRGEYATGGQTSGEIWSPKGRLAARLGEKNQEHCVVYNMMRLSQYLFRWTGESRYADYWERGLLNGIYAQGFCPEGNGDYTTVTYYLPMQQGARKGWGSKTEDFWCCHCTLVQANAVHNESIYYQDASGLVVAQYMPSETVFSIGGTAVHVEQRLEGQTGGDMLKDFPVNREVENRPMEWLARLEIDAKEDTDCEIAFRIPWWIVDKMDITINGERAEYQEDALGFAHVRRVWRRDTVLVRMKKTLRCVSLPDDPDMIAFLDGPVCLAGLVGEEHMLYGDPENPIHSLLCPSDERHWQYWREDWKTRHQPFGIRFVPLYRIVHEAYTTYFPVKRQPLA